MRRDSMLAADGPFAVHHAKEAKTGNETQGIPG
jgi:hypothetical protein